MDTQHPHPALPLAVDLDGTLLKSDSLWESVFLLLRRAPYRLLLLPVWILRSRAYLKQKLASEVMPEFDRLPYHPQFLAFLREEFAKGRPLVLVTAADQRIADRIAEHLGIFQRAIGSAHGVNLSGKRKAELLVRAYGEQGFDYAGNERRDLEVWPHARHAILVNAPRGVVASASRGATVERIFDDRRNEAATLLGAIRPHQWLKNLLIFVPVVTSHQTENLPLLHNALIAFVSFSFTTSGVYLLNDLLDLSSDRIHRSKKTRALAAGDLSLSFALTVMPLFLLCGLLLSFVLPVPFQRVLLIYLCGTVAYSFYFKQVELFDVLLLAALYTVRVIAGHAATGIAYSFWLLMFSMFLFFSLALLKRYAELEGLTREQRMTASGRGYVTGDREQVGMMGTASGYLSVLVFALYAHSPEQALLYTRPMVLWLICPLLLYWISRLWLLAHRGRVHEDPILFALKDPVSYVVALLAFAVMMTAT